MNFSFDPTTILIIILGLALVALAWMVWQLDAKLKKFLRGKSENLDDSILNMNGSIKDLESFKSEMEKYLLTVETRLKKSVQGVHTIRFNPFKNSTGSGGNQSFATALLDEQGNGVIISSLYARDHVSIFAKPISNGTSEYELSEEETQAVKEALKMVK